MSLKKDTCYIECPTNNFAARVLPSSTRLDPFLLRDFPLLLLLHFSPLPILINLKTLWETTWSEGGSFQVWEKEGRPKSDTSFPGRRSDTFLFSFSLSFSFIHPEVTIRWVFFLLLSKLSSFPKQRKDFGPKRQREREREREPAATVKGILI